MWIKSELNYLELHCQDNKHLVRSTLKEFVDKLPSDIFLQYTNHFAINTRHIRPLITAILGEKEPNPSEVLS